MSNWQIFWLSAGVAAAPGLLYSAVIVIVSLVTYPPEWWSRRKRKP